MWERVTEKQDRRQLRRWVQLLC
ncbi:protein of unknown function [Candidatus Methylomirabilis oxygeniifera]|uniref:Uncharacterized protein n=1 Tax=Methylomirabilis oxygeniifera TaxID=671143 RepID=D5MM63_METO1|nr:protein of unknown function [Candidatus Methylomirabilis oxyfera]